MDVSKTGVYKREDIEQLLIDGQKTKRKLQKVQQRRDHYARLYYQALMQLDMTKLELDRAHQEISKLKGQVARQMPYSLNGKLGVGSNTTSPDSGTSVSPGQGHLDAGFLKHVQPPAFCRSDAQISHTKLNHLPDRASQTHSQDVEIPLHTLTGCSAPSAFSHPRFRRSLSLSQTEPAFAPHTLVAKTQSFQSHKPLRATASLPYQEIPSSSNSAESCVSAFKQFACSERSFLSQPLPQPPLIMHSSSTITQQTPNLVCDRQEMRFDSVASNDLLTIYCQLSSLTCPVIKLELSNCQLGHIHNMKLFCKYLVRNKSIEELSLPLNGITLESLSLLLDSVQECPSIKELLLRNNLIGQECASMIKEFLSRATLDSLVLTGNDIEHYSHLLDGSLPSDFAMEFGPRRDNQSIENKNSESTDSADNEHNTPHSFPGQSAFKYLRI